MRLLNAYIKTLVLAVLNVINDFTSIQSTHKACFFLFHRTLPTAECHFHRRLGVRNVFVFEFVLVRESFFASIRRGKIIQYEPAVNRNGVNQNKKTRVREER